MVKQGFKQTEIGVIPEEWKIASLKDLSDGRFTYGVNAPAIPYAPPLPNYIRITDISDDGRFMRESRKSVDCQNPEMYTLKENDIVFARTGASTGKTYLYRKNDGDLVYAGFLIKASILPEKANSKYVFDNLHTNRYWDWVSVTSMRSGQPGINGNEYASYMIPCPSLPEQEHIAEVLSDVDSMISSLEKLIAKKKAIKQGAMQELLTGKKRLPGFTGEWKEKQIGAYGDFVSGNGFPLKYQGNPSGLYPFYKVSDFNNVGNSREMIKANNYISDDVVNILSCNIIPKQSIVFAKIGAAIALERKRITSCVCCIDNNMMSFQPYEKETAQFMCYLFQTIRFGELVEATALPSLSGKTIGEIKKIFPPTSEEQIAISSILSDMDNEIEALERKLEKTRQIKQGMMQQLLTGKIRLV